MSSIKVEAKHCKKVDLEGQSWEPLHCHKSNCSCLGSHSLLSSAISAIEGQKQHTRALCPLFPAVLSDLRLDRSCIKTPWETQRECFRLALSEWMTFCHSAWVWGSLILPSTLNRTRLIFFLGLQCIVYIKRPFQSELSNGGLVVLESQKTVTVCCKNAWPQENKTLVLKCQRYTDTQSP